VAAQIASWRYVVSTASVVIAHGALAMIGRSPCSRCSRGPSSASAHRVLDDGAGRDGDGAVGWLSYLSASRMTTQRLTTLLVSFIGIGTLAAMITTSDPMWWTYHFSQLGTFGDMSSFLFNGTLIAGGLLVTTFTLYVSHDLPRWASRRAASCRRHSPRDHGRHAGLRRHLPRQRQHAAAQPVGVGMALMFLLLLVGGPWIVRRMPRAYFLASWAFLAGLLVSIALFATATSG
jgi:hypothetical protein